MEVSSLTQSKKNNQPKNNQNFQEQNKNYQNRKREEFGTEADLIEAPKQTDNAEQKKQKASGQFAKQNNNNK